MWVMGPVPSPDFSFVGLLIMVAAAKALCNSGSCHRGVTVARVSSGVGGVPRSGVVKVGWRVRCSVGMARARSRCSASATRSAQGALGKVEQDLSAGPGKGGGTVSSR